MALNWELLKKEYQEAISQYKTQEEYWVPEFGKNLIRILPPRDNTLFYKKVGVHYRLAGSGMEFCPKVISNERCPVCEVVERLRGLNTSGAVQLINRLRVTEKFLMNIIPLNQEQKTIRQYLAPKTVRLALLQYVLDPDCGDITDLERGRNVSIEKIQGGGKYVQYLVTVSMRTISLREVLGREILMEEIPDLNEFVATRVKSYEDLMVSLYGSPEELDLDSLLEKYSEEEKIEAKEVMREEVEEDKFVDVSKTEKKKEKPDIDELLELARKLVNGQK
jgi:hypothetical protein